MRVQAVIFDIGGVIIRDQAMREKACAALSVKDQAAFWKAFNEAALPACRGEEAFSEVWHRVARSLGTHVSPEVARSLWIDDFEQLITIDQEVLAMAARLRESVSTGVISNTIKEHAVILKRLGIYEPFDHVVLSHEARMTKDSDGIFDLAIKKFGCPASEIVFIDDVEKFRAVAERKGMIGLLFEGAEKLRVDLAKLGLKIE